MLTLEHGMYSSNRDMKRSSADFRAHHYISSLTGPRRHALPCGGPAAFSAITEKIMVGEPFYTFGNERLELHYENSGPTKAGYYITADDHLSAMIELMNMSETPKDVFFLIEYEYLLGKPAGYLDARPLQLAMCELGQVKPPNNSTFILESAPMSSPIEGPIILAGGHVHDGGLRVDIFVDDKVICDSITSYGGRPEFVQASPASGLNSMKGMEKMQSMSHISDQTECHNVGELKKGQKLKLKAYYDLSKWHGMTDLSGNLGEVMGLAMLHVGRPMP
jgi:hypothetical protein